MHDCSVATPACVCIFVWAKKNIAGTEEIRKQIAPKSHLRRGDANMPHSEYAAFSVKTTARVMAKTPQVEGWFGCQRACLAT